MQKILSVVVAFAAGCGYASVQQIAEPEDVPEVAGMPSATAEGEYAPPAEEVAEAEPDVQPEPVREPACPITLERDPFRPDMTPSHPIGLGSQNWLIGQFGIRPTCEDVDVVHVILYDQVGGSDTAADFFTDLRVIIPRFDGREWHFGAHVSELFDRPDQPYWFSPVEPSHVIVGSGLGLVYYIDALRHPAGDLASVNGIAPFSVEVIAVGRVSGERMSATLTDQPRLYFAEAGSLRVEAYTPSDYDETMRCGSRRAIAHVKLTAGEREHIGLAHIPLKLVTNGDRRVFRNLQLVPEGRPLWQASETMETVDEEGVAHFQGFRLTIWAGTSEILAVYADVLNPEGDVDQLFHFTVRGEDEGPHNPSIVASGHSSGAFIMGEEMRYGSGEEDELVETSRYTIVCP